MNGFIKNIRKRYRLRQETRELIGETLFEFVQLHVNLEFRGGRWWGLCPFHHEETPSFMVNPRKGEWYCFGCEKDHRGDLADFIRRLADREVAKVREAEWRERN